MNNTLLRIPFSCINNAHFYDYYLGFGSFRYNYCATRIGRNPKKGKLVSIVSYIPRKVTRIKVQSYIRMKLYITVRS